ncbi:hypothetical protein HAX54_048878, partial [Datura stramonium]|nr:hypothetical protein [Datura stramonium]
VVDSGHDNVGVIIKDVLRKERVKKVQSFGFGGLLTQFLHGHQIEEEEADDSPTYDPRGIDETKTKDPEGVHHVVISVNNHNAQIDNMLSHLYGMQMLQLRINRVAEEKLQQLNMDYPLSEHLRALCRVGPGFEEPLYNDVAIEDEMERVDSDMRIVMLRRRILKWGKLLFPPLTVRIRGLGSSSLTLYSMLYCFSTRDSTTD